MGVERYKAEHRPLCVANVFIQMGINAKRPVKPMQLLGLVYIAQCWKLGIYGTPLFEHDIEAWRYMPVVPDVYYAVKHYARLRENAINDRIHGVDDTVFSERERAVLKQIWNIHGDKDGQNLRRMATKYGTPWERHRSKNPAIPKARIKAHYARLYVEHDRDERRGSENAPPRWQRLVDLMPIALAWRLDHAAVRLHRVA